MASEENGKYMYVEGRMLTSSGEPISGVVMETWETDDEGEQHSILSVSSLLTVVVRSSSTRGHYDTRLTECPARNCCG
jgi:protocatechuate 3,4-dioxygenase beta subunit